MPNIVNELKKDVEQKHIEVEKRNQTFLECFKEELKIEDDMTMQQLDIFGTSAAIKKAQAKIEEINEIKANSHLTYKAIRNVCLKYALRFLPAKLYIGNIPFKALDDIRKYKLANKDKQISDKRFYVIAPKQCFALTDRPKPIDPVIVYDISEYKKEYKTPYDNFEELLSSNRITYEKEAIYEKRRFDIVTSFGNDFTWTRRLFGIWANYFKLITLTLFAFITIEVLHIFWNSINKFTDKNASQWTFSFVIFFFVMVTVFAIISSQEEHNSRWEKPYKK
jgi:hypothetical protein